MISFWHDNIIAVFLGVDDLGEDYPTKLRRKYCVSAEYADGTKEKLPGTFEDGAIATQEVRRYAKLITELNGVECNKTDPQPMKILSDSQRKRLKDGLTQDYFVKMKAMKQEKFNINNQR